MIATIIFERRDSMSEKSQYHTRQRTLLLEYLTTTKKGWFSSRDIIDEPSLDLGEATVYRMLSKLTEEGLLEKKPADNGHGALYRCSETVDCHGHVHLRCLVCDNTFCLHSEELEKAEQDIGSKLGFSVDESKTTLYGVCSSCKHAEGK